MVSLSPGPGHERRSSPTVHSTPTTNVPLLNQYKHALLRRRLLQTLTGGVKIRKAPWYIHLIQIGLWITPFVFALPFIVVGSLGLWNVYYNALVYGCMQGLCVLLMETVGAIIRHLHSKISVKTTVGGAQLDDEESVEFDLDLCCSFETFDFIFARKKIHSLILHPLVSGLFAFSGCFLLQPSIMLESMHIAGVVFVSIIGWYTVCSAHYSLSISPPQVEIATYRPTDPLELRFLKRPFYVMAIAAIFIPLRLFVSPPSVVLYLQLLYASLCLLPLGWLVGFLPPLDVLIPWIMEQGLTRLMGGSPMATDLRLTVMFLISSMFVAIVVSLHNDTLSVLFATVFGFLLSQDLFTCLKSPMYLLSFISKSKLLQSVHNQITTKTYTSLCGWDFNALSKLRTFVFHYLVSIIKGTTLLGTSLVIVYFTFTSNGESGEFGTRITAGLVISLFCLLQGSYMFQRLYILGLFRNPLFPKQCENVTKFERKRRLLHYFGIPGGFTRVYLAPVLLLSFVGFSLKIPNASTGSSINIPRVWNGIMVARILRKVWQNTSSAHFEVTVVAVLHFIIPSNNLWVSVGSAFQVFIVGLATEILQDFLQKFWFAATAFANFIFIPKLRTYFPLTVLITMGTLIFLPFLLAIIFISSLFSSPLLPLFTLPIFFVSFPRTKRFWPSLINYASSYSKCEDSIYYRQAETEIVKVLHRTISSGAISASPGTFLLLRFEDRLITVSFLEHGYGHCSLVIKGLELQETSCHSIEATKIDNIFEDAYDPSSNGCPKFWFNTHFPNTLHPVDSEVIKVYSDAHNVLTGIIDQPSSLQRFPDNLLKCMVWVLLRYFLQACTTEPKNESTFDTEKTSPLHAHCKTNCDSSQTEETKEANGSKNAWTISEETCTKHVEHTNRDTLSWSESISSFDEADPMHADKLNTESIYTLDAVNSLPGLIPEDRPLDNPDLRHMVITTIETNDRPNSIDNVTQSEVRLSAIPISGISGMQQAGNLEAMDYKMPQKWREQLPLKHSQLNNFKTPFPTDWLEFLLKYHKKNSSTFHLKEQLVDIVMLCFAIVDVGTSSHISGRRTEETKPFDIFEGFCGRFPSSIHSHWLTGDELLNGLVLKAYRYAVKLMYDEVSIGEVEDFSELTDYLESYTTDYFIGLEEEEGWVDGVATKIQHLFALGRDIEKNVYTAHILSLQPHVVHIGQLNPTAVRGIWSDLSFELFYLTNDDEERYSIQAHSTLLRNLTIQVADSPLGYYIYSSGILRAPCT